MKSHICNLLLLFIILCALFLCSCTEPNTITLPTAAQPELTTNVHVTPEFAPTAAPTAEQSSDDEWMDKWLEVCRNIYAEPCGWGCAITPYNKNEIFPQASGVFKNMLPVLDTAIKATAVTQYQKPVQEWAVMADDRSVNENDVNDPVCAWVMLKHMTVYIGKEHPEAQQKWVSTGRKWFLPIDAARDIMKICFADFTDDMPMPTQAPQYKCNEIDDTFDFEYSEKENGYFFEPCERSVSGSQNLICSMHTEGAYFYMRILTLGGQTNYDINGVDIWLAPAAKPYPLECEWRIQKMVRLPNLTNGLSICDGN